MSSSRSRSAVRLKSCKSSYHRIGRKSCTDESQEFLPSTVTTANGFWRASFGQSWRTRRGFLALADFAGEGTVDKLQARAALQRLVVLWPERVNQP